MTRLRGPRRRGQVPMAGRGSWPARRGVRIVSAVCSDAAGWARSTKPSTSTAAAASRSKCCAIALRMPTSARDSLREGQFAASISHPHTVYIFGSEEIAGTPIISMELLAGGTLKDRVAARARSAGRRGCGGPRHHRRPRRRSGRRHPSSRHQAVELLHGSRRHGEGRRLRSLDLDAGTRRAPRARHGRIPGHAAFAAPEQLRGEPLDVRADIYAVGATLYWLLTGKPPFDTRDLQGLVKRVTTEPPVSPRVLRPAIPAGVAAVVVRCLAKNAAERPASYAELAHALRPFAPHQDPPASPAARVLASIVDSLVIAGISAIGGAALVTMLGTGLGSGGWNFLPNAAYFFILEGRWVPRSARVCYVCAW